MSRTAAAADPREAILRRVAPPAATARLLGIALDPAPDGDPSHRTGDCPKCSAERGCKLTVNGTKWWTDCQAEQHGGVDLWRFAKGVPRAQAVASLYRATVDDGEAPPQRLAPILEHLPDVADLQPDGEQVVPLDALGPLLSGAVLAVEDRNQAPRSLCLQSVLATAALAAQGRFDVRLPHGRRAPLSCMFLSIADSGLRKSSVDFTAQEGVREVERGLRDGYPGEELEHANAADAYKVARDGILRDGRKGMPPAELKAALGALGEPPAPPLRPLLTCDEPTMEGLFRLFQDGRPSLGLFGGEGGVFLGGYAMGKDRRLATISALSQLWDGSPWKRVRGSEDAAVLAGRRLTVHLSVQPVVAETLLRDEVAQGQGVLGRFLMVAVDADAYIGHRVSRDHNPRLDPPLADYHRRAVELLSVAPPLREGVRGEVDLPALELAAPARRRLRDFADEVERRCAVGGDLSGVRPFGLKMPEHAARLAAVLATFERSEELEQVRLLSVEDVERGIALALYYGEEVRRLLSGKLPEDEDAALLLRWLQEWPAPRVSLPDVCRLGPNRLRQRDRAAAAVDVLERHGRLIAAGRGEVQGTPRRETWLLNLDGTRPS